MSRTVSDEARRQGRTIRLVLGLVFLLFVGILIMVAIISKRANPIMLDENGKRISRQAAPWSNRG